MDGGSTPPTSIQVCTGAGSMAARRNVDTNTRPDRPCGGAGFLGAKTLWTAGGWNSSTVEHFSNGERVWVSNPTSGMPPFIDFREVAQPGSAPGLGPGGRGFKSRLSDQ